MAKRTTGADGATTVRGERATGAGSGHELGAWWLAKLAGLLRSEVALSPSTVADTRVALNQVLDCAVDHHLIAINPARRVHARDVNDDFGPSRPRAEHGGPAQARLTEYVRGSVMSRCFR